jgi:hypothetical protein
VLGCATESDGDARGSSTGSSGDATATEATGGGTDATSGPAESSSGVASTSGAAEATTDAADTSGTTSGVGEDLDMTPEDFVCVLDWDLVRRFRITNLLGHLDETLAVAQSPDGGVYPVGTVIQLIPGEAMVKRATGWSPETNDWEFFSLATSADGTEILARGATRVVNQFGGNCFDCHSAAEPQWDLVCETDHGCAPLPIGPDVIAMLQNGDPRCP